MSERTRQLLRVLVIDDDSLDAEILRRGLKKCSEFLWEFVHEASAASGLEAARQGSFDIVFVDHQLGVRNGTEVVSELREIDYPAAIVGYSGRREYEEEFLQAGACTFLPKDDAGEKNLGRLISSLELGVASRRPG